ncbi:MAG: TolC family protein [Elusimicrobiota bacterium]|jgi:outer membrane protein TolC|nr:TolC family protein [Elusimicrobiota bacterium]
MIYIKCRKISALLSALIFCAGSAVAFSLTANASAPQKETFTLDGYIRAYIKNSPAAVQDFNALKTAEINFRNRTVNLFLPSAGASAGATLLTKNESLHFDGPYDASLYVNWNIFNSGRDYLAYKKQKNLLETSRMRFKNSLQELALSAIKTFYDLKRKESLLEVAARDLEEKLEQYEMTRLLYRDGLKTYTDFLQSENTLKNAELDMEQKTADYNSSLINFNNQIGREIMSAAKLDYEIETAPEFYQTSFDDDLQTAVANREDVNREILNFQNAKIDNKLTLMNNLPMLSAGFNLGNNTDDIFGARGNRTDYSVSLSFSVPIGFLWIDKYNDVRVSKMDLINNYMDFEKLFRNIKENIFNVRNSLKFQLTSIDISKNNLKIAQERLDIARAKYNEGNADSWELYNAQEQYLSALIRDTNLKYDYQLNIYSYKRALGLDIYDESKLVLDNKDFTDDTIKRVERGFLSDKK